MMPRTNGTELRIRLADAADDAFILGLVGRG